MSRSSFSFFDLSNLLASNHQVSKYSFCPVSRLVALHEARGLVRPPTEQNQRPDQACGKEGTLWKKKWQNTWNHAGEERVVCNLLSLLQSLVEVKIKSSNKKFCWTVMNQTKEKKAVCFWWCLHFCERWLKINTCNLWGREKVHFTTFLKLVRIRDTYAA